MTKSVFSQSAVSLPHPHVSTEVIQIIANAIAKAWDLLKSSTPKGFDLMASVEDEITYRMYQILSNEVLAKELVPGFSRKLFRVSREPKVATYNGSSIDKMPDLFVHLISDRAISLLDQDGLFAECKPVGTSHPVGSCYCDTGVVRFVRGEYAWAMQEAMMIAYVKDSYKIDAKLVSAVCHARRASSMCYVDYGSGSISVKYKCQTVFTTNHRRTFRYSNGENSRPITMYHLWLDM